MNIYLILKSLHLIAVISWMAGLLYLPRIFVYHSENKLNNDISGVFKIMERRLYFYIMYPAMLLSWIFGVTIIHFQGIELLKAKWFLIKIIAVIILTGYHEYLGKCLLSLKNRTNTKTSKFYRYINEAPTVLLILIVFVVIIKPPTNSLYF